MKPILLLSFVTVTALSAAQSPKIVNTNTVPGGTP